MARQPIILESNLITDDYGALPGSGTYYDTGDAGSGAGTVQNEDGTFTIPKFQMESNAPTFDLSNMQNIYGTEYMPMFNWINKVQTGSYVYDPDEDTKEIDRLQKKFEEEQGEAAAAALAREKEMYKQEAIALGGQITSGIGAQFGRALVAAPDEGLSGAATEYMKGGPMNMLGYGSKDDPSKLTSKISDSGQFTVGRKRFEFAGTEGDAGVAARAAIDANPTNPLENQASKDYLKTVEGNKEKTDAYNSALAVIPDKQNFTQGIYDRSGFKTVVGPEGNTSMSAAGKANLAGAAGAGLTSVAYNLATGKNLKESVKAGAKQGLFTYVGGLLGPIGGLIGGILGGRVICNELHRQGIMTRKQVVLDYKFTRDYLTPTHVNGYHVWAVWMVKQMRKGRFVGFWKHVAGHRANEIAYIYGERATPDYLGKAYRKILEPICWSIGFFCKKTDWTVLYTQKEI